MNIWYVHPYAGGPGVGRYMRPYSLAKHWEDMGAKVVIFTTANHHQLDKPRSVGTQVIEGITYEFLKGKDYKGNGLQRLVNMFGAAWDFWRHADKFVETHGIPDVIISSSPHPYLYPAVFKVAKRFNAKVIFEVRDLWPLSFIELFGMSRMHPLVGATGWIEKHAYRNAYATVSLLPLTAAYMQTRGLSSDRWHYIPNGVDSAPSCQETQPEVVSFGCLQRATELRRAGKTVVVYVGGLGEPNNVESLVSAVAHCHSCGFSKIAAIIVGRGEMRAKLDSQVVENGLQSSIFLYDQVPKTVITQLLNLVDIGYISLKPGPLFHFGISPNKIFDYMSSGLPIVSAIDAGNDLVKQASCGISVTSGRCEDIADALIKVSKAAEEKKIEWSQNGRTYVQQNHSYKVLATKYLEVFK